MSLKLRITNFVTEFLTQQADRYKNKDSIEKLITLFHSETVQTGLRDTIMVGLSRKREVPQPIRPVPQPVRLASQPIRPVPQFVKANPMLLFMGQQRKFITAEHPEWTPSQIVNEMKIRWTKAFNNKNKIES